MVRELKPDVVLLDYSMPVMNGVEAARAISKYSSTCRILLFTMLSQPLSTTPHAAGIRAVISKEVGGMSAIVEAIQGVACKAS